MSNILAVAGPNSKYQEPNASSAGFWAGLWHGIILPFAFLASIFTSKVRIYEVNNRGLAYDVGFVLGLLFWSGGGTASAGVG